MRKLILIAGFAALVACGQKQEPAATEDTNATVAEADSNAADTNAAAMVTANGSLPGTYEVTMKDGSKGQTTLSADGSYVDKNPNGTETKGTWNVAGDKTCFDPEGDEGPTCYSESETAADGTFTATPDKGDPVTVKKVV